MNSILIRTIKSIEELHQLLDVFSLAFDTTYNVSDEYLSQMLENNSCLILGAFKHHAVVGGIVAFEFYPIHGDKEFYLYDIAVHPEYQKQGIGKQMINHLKQESRARGIKSIFVDAESQDEDAVRFYRAIGGQELSVKNFTFLSTTE